VNDPIIPEDSYQSFESILSNGTVDANTQVIFKSNEIILNANFEVLQPAIFEALIEPDACVDQFCPPIEDAPTFTQALPNVTLMAEDSCMATIQIPFQIDYRFPDRLSVDFFWVNNFYGYDNDSLTINLDAVNGSISNYMLAGTLPFGINKIQLDVEDKNCNLSTKFKFTVSVTDTFPPKIECPPHKEFSLNQNCEFLIPDFMNEVVITNSCTSYLNGGDISQSPSPGTIVNGLISDSIIMTATNYENTTYSCSFNLTVVDSIAPEIICPANGNVSVPLDADCQSIIPDIRNVVDNCDALIPADSNELGPIIYQIPQPGSIWDGNEDLLIVAVDGSGNRDSCQLNLQRSCPAVGHSPLFLQ